MNRNRAILVIGVLLTAIIMSFAGTALASGQQPKLPNAFSGDLTIYGPSGSAPAPIGTEVVAKVGGEVRGRLTTIEEGAYGDVEDIEVPDLYVGAEHYIEEGATIEFYANGIKADQTATFESGADTKLNLTVHDAVAPVVTIDPVTTPTNMGTQTITGTFDEAFIGTIVVNGVTAAIDEDAGTYSADVPLVEGTNTITVTATDLVGNVGTTEATIVLDTTKPTISDISASGITVTGASITWTTDEPATSEVEYGTSEAYGLVESDATPTTSHSIALTNLASGTEYHYRVKSADGVGNESVSPDRTFTTEKVQAAVTTESATDITTNSATLNASIDYGDYMGVDIAFFYREVGGSWVDTGLDTVTAASYSKGITGLKEGTTYEFYAYIEFDGLDDTGATRSFTTTAVVPPEKATLTVDTTPVKGEVFVDGVSWGTAPQTMKLDADTYTVSFGAVSGYTTPSARTVTLAAGETRTVTGTYVIIPPEKANLTVDTTPVKGEVFVGGVSWGTAPQTRLLDAGTYTVSFGDVPDYETPDSETVTLAAGETKTVTGIYTEIPTPAEFELSDLVISPTEVEVGETVTISVDVANVGGTAGTCPVTLKINEIAVDTEDITLAAGTTGTVAFEVTEEVADTYAVDVDGLTGEFTVTTPPLRVPLEVVATVLIVALLLVIFIWVRRGRTK